MFKVVGIYFKNRESVKVNKRITDTGESKMSPSHLIPNTISGTPDVRIEEMIDRETSFLNDWGPDVLGMVNIHQLKIFVTPRSGKVDKVNTSRWTPNGNHSVTHLQWHVNQRLNF